MKSRQRILACGLFAMFAAGGCGDDDNGSAGGGGVVTGLPRSDKLSSLSDQDSMQACTKTTTALNSLLTKPEIKRLTCDGVAVESIVEDAQGDVDSSDIPMCKKLSSECQSSGEIKDEDLVLELADEADCDGTKTEDMFGECEATVADYESCMSRVMKELRTRFLSLTCDVLSDVSKIDETLNGDVDVSDAPECQAIKTKCPDVDLVIEASAEG
jgi:hypothetical protein